jgi:coupling of ubiquitin conjugation to ER degradation protein 1
MKPPQTFQPPLPASASSSSTATTENKPPVTKPSQPDLITRYNLAAKVANADSEGEGPAENTNTAAGKSAWSSNKNERQALLQKRREEMILAARRKMQAKLTAEAGAEMRQSGRHD